MTTQAKALMAPAREKATRELAAGNEYLALAQALLLIDCLVELQESDDGRIELIAHGLDAQAARITNLHVESAQQVADLWERVNQLGDTCAAAARVARLEARVAELERKVRQ